MTIHKICRPVTKTVPFMTAGRQLNSCSHKCIETSCHSNVTHPWTWRIRSCVCTYSIHARLCTRFRERDACDTDSAGINSLIRACDTQPYSSCQGVGRSASPPRLPGWLGWIGILVHLYGRFYCSVDSTVCRTIKECQDRNSNRASSVRCTYPQVVRKHTSTKQACLGAYCKYLYVWHRLFLAYTLRALILNNFPKNCTMVASSEEPTTSVIRITSITVITHLYILYVLVIQIIV